MDSFLYGTVSQESRCSDFRLCSLPLRLASCYTANLLYYEVTFAFLYRFCKALHVLAPRARALRLVGSTFAGRLEVLVTVVAVRKAPQLV